MVALQAETAAAAAEPIAREAELAKGRVEQRRSAKEATEAAARKAANEGGCLESSYTQDSDSITTPDVF